MSLWWFCKCMATEFRFQTKAANRAPRNWRRVRNAWQFACKWSDEFPDAWCNLIIYVSRHRWKPIGRVWYGPLLRYPWTHFHLDDEFRQKRHYQPLFPSRTFDKIDGLLPMNYDINSPNSTFICFHADVPISTTIRFSNCQQQQPVIPLFGKHNANTMFMSHWDEIKNKSQYNYGMFTSSSLRC